MASNNLQEIVVMKDLTGYLTSNEIDRLIAACKRPRDALLFKLLRSSGRRITEIVGRRHPYRHKYIYKGEVKEVTYPPIPALTPMDIVEKEENGRQVRMIRFNILKKKTLTTKLKPINDETFEELRDYIFYNDIQMKQPIFNLSRARVFQIVRECAEIAGINLVGTKKPHPHHFRHSFAVNVIQNSDDPSALRKVQMALEHSSLNVTAGYMQFNQEDLRQMLNKTFNKKDKEDEKDV
jgi:site-specific recombinase XerD